MFPLSVFYYIQSASTTVSPLLSLGRVNCCAFWRSQKNLLKMSAVCASIPPSFYRSSVLLLSWSSAFPLLLSPSFQLLLTPFRSQDHGAARFLYTASTSSIRQTASRGYSSPLRRRRATSRLFIFVLPHVVVAHADLCVE